jgi:hypothetical protein
MSGLKENIQRRALSETVNVAGVGKVSRHDFNMQAVAKAFERYREDDWAGGEGPASRQRRIKK